VPGTVDDLAVKYYESSNFKKLSEAAKKNYRRNIDHFRDKVIKGLRLGSLPTAGLKRAHLLVYFDTMADKPGKTYTTMKRLKTLFDFAREREIMRENPAQLLKKPSLKGFRSLEDDDIKKYLAHWKSGTTQHLAMLLLIYTGQRRSDVVRMVRTHVRDGRISVVQQKTKKFLEIPIHPTLQAEIDRIPEGQLVLLQSEQKRAFSGASFGNMFRKWCRDAGLPENSSPHGCRKAAGRMLAEAGCTAREIMAILGHESLSEAERYTKAASQITLAESAIAKLK
jgi:integrase